jgi:hypothetical protein
MRQDQWANSVTIDGEDWGVWDTLAGGAVTASETKYAPGGMGAQKSLGGRTSIDNITLGKLIEGGTDEWAAIKTLMATRCGKAEVGVSRQPLDVDGNKFGDPLVYTGLLLTVTPGDTDSNSEAAQVWQITVSTHGSIA